ncbi:MAG: F-box protein [Terriglobus roseus]|nr:F-box protein [Terriglobus roseus]
MPSKATTSFSVLSVSRPDPPSTRPTSDEAPSSTFVFTIDSFPEELVQNIVSHMDVPTLANAALSCSLLNRLATPFLYRTYVAPWSTPRPFDPFLRTVLERPDLAVYVRRLLVFTLEEVSTRDPKFNYGPSDVKGLDSCASVVGHVCRLERSEVSSRPANKSGLERSRRGQNTPGDYLHVQWLRALEDGKEVARFCVLLCLLPNLEEVFVPASTWADLFYKVLGQVCKPLALEAAWERDDSGLPRATKVNLRSALTRLHSFYTDAGNYHSHWDSTDRIRAMVRVPSLRSYEETHQHRRSLYEDSTFHPAMEVGWPPDKSSAVERLSFASCTVDLYYLKKIIGCIAALKEFRYDMNRKMTRSYSPLTPLALVQALGDHKDSLEVLHVDFADDFLKSIWNDSSGDELCFGHELCSFSRLRSLKCGQQALLEASYYKTEWGMWGRRPWSSTVERSPRLGQVLPRQLQQLSIAYADAQVVPELESLNVAVSLLQFPELKQVHVEFSEEMTVGGSVDLTGASVQQLPLTIASLTREARVAKFSPHKQRMSSAPLGQKTVPHLLNWRTRNMERYEEALSEEFLVPA